MKHLLVFVIVCVLLPNPVQGAQNHSYMGKIAFAEFDPINPVPNTYALHTMNPDGTDDNIIFRTKGDWAVDCRSEDCRLSLDWSPDYQHLLFKTHWLKYAQGAFTHFTYTAVVNADGSGDQVYDTDYTAFKWSPYGKYLAYLYKKGRTNSDTYLELYIANADGSGPKRFTNLDITDFAWSPDGKQIAISSLGTIYIVNVQGEIKFNPITTNDLQVGELHWSPDGKWIAFVYHSGLYTVDVNTHVRRQVFSNVKPNYVNFEGGSCCLWSPTQDYVVILDNYDYSTQETLVNVADGSDTSISASAPRFDTLKWSPKGSPLLDVTLDTNNEGFNWIERAFSTISWIEFPSDQPSGGSLVDAVWSPDGLQVAYLASSGYEMCFLDYYGFNRKSNRNCISALSHYDEIDRLAWAAAVQ